MRESFIICFVLMGIELCVSAYMERPARSKRLVVPDVGDLPDIMEATTIAKTTLCPVVASKPNRLSSELAMFGLKYFECNCGGYVELSGTNEIFYQIPQGLQRVTCVWVVWAKNGLPALVRNVFNEMAQFDAKFTLVVFNTESDASHFKYKHLALGNETAVDLKSATNDYFWVSFTGNPTKEQQGVHIKMSDSGSSSTVGFRPRVKFIQFDQRSGVFKYPPDGSWGYSKNERVFIIGRVPEGKSLEITYKVNMKDKNSAIFYISYLHGQDDVGGVLGLSADKDGATQTHMILDGTAYLLGFVTDGSNVKKGVQINYKYIDWF